MADFAAYFGLFAFAFAAATIVPAQSEALFVGLQVAGYSPLMLVIVAGAGNTLGAVANWMLGRAVEGCRNRPWFPVAPAALERASGWYRRWGRWTLLFSWMPIGGDAVTLAAGVLREPLWSFTLLVGIAKTARYVVLAAATAGLTG